MYNYFSSQKNSRSVTLSYSIRKNTSSTEDSENRDVIIIQKASFIGNMFTIDSRKVFNILKELTLDANVET